MTRTRILAATLAAFTAAATFELEAAPTHEVTITVNTVKALGNADAYSKGDFYARATIDGEVMKTEPIKQSAEIKPNWKLSKKVAPGEIRVKLEIFDKDVSADDLIDINRVDAKRDLDFTVNTKSCKISGFAQTYRCGAKISRAGKENKSADVTFTVTVKK